MTTENKVLNDLVGKTISSVKLGWCGLFDDAVCIGFTDNTFITITGGNGEIIPEDTIIDD